CDDAGEDNHAWTSLWLAYSYCGLRASGRAGCGREMIPQVRKLARQIPGGFIAALAFLGQTAIENPAEVGRNGAFDGGRLVLHNRRHGLDGARAGEGLFSGEQFVQNQTEAELVRAVIDSLLRARLLGTHVRGGADYGTRGRLSHSGGLIVGD